jgi:hypothetical protein
MRLGRTHVAASMLVVLGCVQWAFASRAAAAVTANDPRSGSYEDVASSCEKYETMPVDGGLYDVQTNEWNSNSPQCVGTTGSTQFTVTSSAIDAPTSSSPGSYPSVFRGCHWGICTAGSGLPVQVRREGRAQVSWATLQPSSGAYDVSLDIWFNKKPSTSGAPDGTELMVWIASRGGVRPEGTKVGSLKADGYRFTVWHAKNPTSAYVAYVIRSKTESVRHLSLGPLVRDAVQRRYLRPSWYLIDVEAGFEIWRAGAGLATTSFSFQRG